MADDRRPAYSEVLAALLALRPDPATRRFDALLSALLAEDRIDPAAARELRWWQRESVRSVGDYLGDTAPALLVALESSRQTAEQATEVAARAWEQATRSQAPVTTGAEGPAAPAAAPTAAAAPALHDGPDVVVDLRPGRGTGAGTDPPERPSGAAGEQDEPPPTAPYARATVAPARHDATSTVASPPRRLLITGRSLHRTTVVSRTGRPQT